MPASATPYLRIRAGFLILAIIASAMSAHVARADASEKCGATLCVSADLHASVECEHPDIYTVRCRPAVTYSGRGRSTLSEGGVPSAIIAPYSFTACRDGSCNTLSFQLECNWNGVDATACSDEQTLDAPPAEATSGTGRVCVHVQVNGAMIAYGRVLFAVPDATVEVSDSAQVVACNDL
jgi:hypothetical protein